MYDRSIASVCGVIFVLEVTMSTSFCIQDYSRAHVLLSRDVSVKRANKPSTTMLGTSPRRSCSTTLSFTARDAFLNANIAEMYKSILLYQKDEHMDDPAGELLTVASY